MNPVDGSYDAWEVETFLSRPDEPYPLAYTSRLLQKVRCTCIVPCNGSHAQYTFQLMIVDNFLVAFTVRHQVMTWSLRPRSCQAKGLSSPQNMQNWEIDLRSIRSPDSPLVRLPDQIIDLDSPFDNALSLFVIPSHWYLASPRLPLIFDVTHHPSDFEYPLPWRKATRFRLDLSQLLQGTSSQECSVGGLNDVSGVSLKVERVSRFRFPPCRLSFMENAQIPGWFSVGMSPLSDFETPGSMENYMTCIYEPGLGINDPLGASPVSIGIDNNLDSATNDSDEVGGDVVLENGNGDEPRNARLSMLFHGSLLCIGACVSGRVGHVFHGERGSGICILDQELLPCLR